MLHARHENSKDEGFQGTTSKRVIYITQVNKNDTYGDVAESCFVLLWIIFSGQKLGQPGPGRVAWADYYHTPEAGAVQLREDGMQIALRLLHDSSELSRPRLFAAQDFLWGHRGGKA